MPGTAHTWVDGDIATAARLNALPRGVMAYVLGSSSAQTGITTEVDLTSLSVTWTAVSSRIYQVDMIVFGRQLTSGNTAFANITDAANTPVSGSAFTLAANDYATFYVRELVTGLSGSITRKGRAGTLGGTLSVNPDSQTYRRPTLMVTDMGV